MAMDHQATEQRCRKAANGCLSCDCTETKFADAGRPPASPMFVEGVIRKIEAAASLYLKADGTILPGKLALLLHGRKKTKSSCAGTTGLT